MVSSSTPRASRWSTTSAATTSTSAAGAHKPAGPRLGAPPHLAAPHRRCPPRRPRCRRPPPSPSSPPPLSPPPPSPSSRRWPRRRPRRRPTRRQPPTPEFLALALARRPPPRPRPRPAGLWCVHGAVRIGRRDRGVRGWRPAPTSMTSCATGEPGSARGRNGRPRRRHGAAPWREQQRRRVDDGRKSRSAGPSWCAHRSPPLTCSAVASHLALVAAGLVRQRHAFRFDPFPWCDASSQQARARTSKQRHVENSPPPPVAFIPCPCSLQGHCCDLTCLRMAAPTPTTPMPNMDARLQRLPPLVSRLRRQAEMRPTAMDGCRQGREAARTTLSTRPTPAHPQQPRVRQRRLREPQLLLPWVPAAPAAPSVTPTPPALYVPPPPPAQYMDTAYTDASRATPRLHLSGRTYHLQAYQLPRGHHTAPLGGQCGGRNPRSTCSRLLPRVVLRHLFPGCTCDDYTSYGYTCDCDDSRTLVATARAAHVDRPQPLAPALAFALAGQHRVRRHGGGRVRLLGDCGSQLCQCADALACCADFLDPPQPPPPPSPSMPPPPNAPADARSEKSGVLRQQSRRRLPSCPSRSTMPGSCASACPTTCRGRRQTRRPSLRRRRRRQPPSPPCIDNADGSEKIASPEQGGGVLLAESVVTVCPYSCGLCPLPPPPPRPRRPPPPPPSPYPGAARAAAVRRRERHARVRHQAREGQVRHRVDPDGGTCGLCTQPPAPAPRRR